MKPYRINCEGYFLNKEGNILAKDSRKGFLIFPGGGVDEGESTEKAMIRETKEETGAVVANLKEVNSLKIQWDKHWVHTEKQKQRYEKFQGDEMHFFAGKIIRFENTGPIEDAWAGDKLMKIKDAINFIENNNKDENLKEYREMQIKILKSLV